MKKSLLLLFFSFFVCQLFAYSEPYIFRVYLDGKPGSRPIDLTERAKERRLRLEIEINEQDYSVSESYLQQLRDAGFSVLACSRWLNTAVVSLTDGQKADADLWSKLPFVRNVETLACPASTRSLPFKAKKREEETSEYAAMLDNCTIPLREVNAYDALYQQGYRGKGILIAVFDGGFERLNECSFLKEKVVFAHNLYDPTTPESVYVGDNHGIQCMSIMACPEVEGVCGTAQEASYCLFNTENPNYEKAIEEDMWVAAAEMADSLGVDVISSSLGYSEFDNDVLSHTIADLGRNTVLISQGAKIAAQKGILVVNSAGNSGNKDWEKLLFPADTEEVFTVGAVTPDFVAADFTSQGFLSPYVKPDVSARGTNCYAILPTSRGFGVRTMAAGTSFSTPLIAGLCASLWSAVPELTPAEIREIVRSSSSDYASPNVRTGYGVPDFAVALKKAQEMKGHTGIEQIKSEATDLGSAASNRYYNLMGQPLETLPSQGSFIEHGKVRIIKRNP